MPVCFCSKIRVDINWVKKRAAEFHASNRWRLRPINWLTARAFNHIIYLMTATATILYRTPEKIFSAADRGEKVTIRRGKSEYILSKKARAHALYGCLRGSIKKDLGRPKVRWKAMQ